MFTGRIDPRIRALVISPHAHGITWVPRGTAHQQTRGPLVLGSQAPWPWFGSSREPPLEAGLLDLFALLKKQSLAFYVCPETWPIILWHTLLSLHEYLPPVLQVLLLHAWLLAHTRLPSAFQDVFFSFLRLQQQLPVSVLLLPLMPSTSGFFFPPAPPTHPTHTARERLVDPRGWVMGSKLLFCVSELMNTHPYR